MKYLLDLDGDWFAIGPDQFADWDQNMAGDVLFGTVLANVRTDWPPDNWRGFAGTFTWSDPPFVQVAEVLPIIDGDDPCPTGPHVALTYDSWVTCDGERPEGGGAMIRTATYGSMPGAVPGGWAIRVKPADCPTCDGLGKERLGRQAGNLRSEGAKMFSWRFGGPCPLCTRPPAAEGKALNAAP